MRSSVIYSTLLIAFLLPGIAFAQNDQEQNATTEDDKTWTFNAGLGSSKAWNLLGITKEYLVNDYSSVFVTAGLGEMILGAGVAFYTNREGDGVVASAVAGTGLQFTLTYRWNLEGSDFLALGASYIQLFGFSDVNHPSVLPVCAYEHQF